METPSNEVETTTLTLQGQATAEQIATWKRTYTEIYQYQVDNKVCYFRMVDRALFDMATKKMETSPSKFNEAVLNGVWLGGCEELRISDRYYFGLIEYVEELMGKKKGILSKL